MVRRKGSVQRLILFMLSDRDMCGYTLRKEISKITESHDVPSCGSIYPALKELEKEGLIESRKSDKKILYKINENGRNAIKNQIKLGFKELMNKFGVYENIFRKDDILLTFRICHLFEKQKDKKKAKKILTECIKKLEDGQDAKK
ncbi:MAG: PadR family transcriptional regulator [Candidatus Aenigmarchaeota archaeon]|nr:PadR family transcriptional regulator [Candidatus Aenigmarchaeota archaeon]